MGDLQFWDGNYGNVLDGLESQLHQVREAYTPSDRDQLASTAASTVRRLQGIKRSYNLEIKLTRDTGLKAMYTDAKAAKDARLEQLEAQLEEARRKPGREAERAALFDGRAIEMAPAADAKLDQASAIQDKTEARYKNMVTVLAQTEEIGTAAAASLADQRTQMVAIDEDVKVMHENLTRAGKLLHVFGKRLATDKFIQCFGFVNVALLVGIILYVVITKTGLSSSGASNPPPTPA
ncbi:soluble NSF attachment protein receptor [Tribonema minus]|uniref:Soluble NSF attachment protein receptor n=1 Tax=Tribonema minus TaxID=303371 RepID=A0A835Z325_9STRA|nr:soluble NSF attachment protein receptor [Tribonema minus]